MLQPIMSIRDWLKKVKENLDDSRWMAAHEDELYTLLKSHLQKPPTFHDAVELLMLVFPKYALVLFHAKRWWPLMFSALQEAQNLRDNEMQIQILTFLGEVNLAMGNNDAARSSFEIALGRAKEGQTDEMMLAALIGFIRIQSVRMGDEYDPNLISTSLELSRKTSDLNLIASLHEAILLAYVHRQETLPAIEHGQIAYVYWHHLQNKLEMAKTLYLLSAAYRFMLLPKRAEDLLRLASEHFDGTDYIRQYAILSYETGALHLMNKDYEAARQWLTIGMGEAIHIEYYMLEVSCRHALGIAETGLDMFDPAETHLKQAIIGWEKLKTFDELASAYQALGNLENKRRRPEEALKNLKKAQELCLKVPPSERRVWLENHIQETIDELEW